MSVSCLSNLTLQIGELCFRYERNVVITQNGFYLLVMFHSGAAKGCHNHKLAFASLRVWMFKYKIALSGLC